MTVSLATLTTDVKAALRETGALDWSDAQIQAAIAQALGDYNAVAPFQKTTTYAATGRTVTLATALGATDSDALRSLEAIEYPVGNWPPTYVRWSLFGGVMTLHTTASLTAENIVISYTVNHTLTAAPASTVPDAHEQLLALGGAAYALRQLAAGAENVLTLHHNTGPSALALSNERMDAFRAGLQRLQRIKVTTIYRPGEPTPSKNIVTLP